MSKAHSNKRKPKSKTLSLQEGDSLYFQSKYPEAYKVYYSVLKAIPDPSNKNIVDQTTLYHKLGLSSFKLAKFSCSHNYLTRALELTKSSKEAKVLETARILYAIGDTYVDEAEFLKAEENYKEAMELVRDNYGEEHREMGICYNKLGNLIQAQGNYPESFEYLNTAVKIFTGQETQGDTELATSYSYMARAYGTLGECDKAKDYTHRTLAIRQEVYGLIHVDIAMCYNILGMIEQNQKRRPEALGFYRQAFKILVKCLGKSHLDVADSYCKIGRVYYRMGHYGQARANYSKALKIEKQFVSKNHPYLAYTYLDFANSYKEQGDYKKALEYYEKTLKVLSEKLGDEHMQVARTLDYVIELHKEQGFYSAARKIAKRQLNIFIKNLERNDSEVANAYNTLGTLYYQDKKYKKAMENYLMAYKIRGSLKEKQLPEEGVCFYDISFVFNAVHNLGSAENMAKKSLKLFEKADGRDHDDTREAVDALENVQKTKCLQDVNIDFTF